MNDQTEAAARPRWSRWELLALLALLLLALAVRFRGIDWPHFHPDEPTIAGWIQDTADDGIVRHYGYPSGFFNLLHPIRNTIIRLQRLADAGTFWTGGLESRPDGKMDDIALARRFNAVLGALTVVLIYLLARRVTGHRPAACFAAILLTFAPHHAEHARYAETDMALIFMLAVSLLAWARALDTPRLTWIFLASLLTGVAVGTKYTIVLLLILPLFALARRFDTARPGRSALLTVRDLAICIALILLGFIWANPGALEFEWFSKALRRGAERTFAERVSLLGAERHIWWVPILANLRVVWIDLQTLGPGWLLLALLGVAPALARVHRRYLVHTVLVPALLLIHLAFVAPWVRAQELLPLYPSLCLLAALPIACLPSLRGRFRFPARLLVSALALWALLVVVPAGARLGPLFQWKEPRLQARDWLMLHAPEDSVLGFERYTHYAARDYPGGVADVFKIERFGRERIEKLGCDFVIRNPYGYGRGTLDPRTAQRRPEYQARFDTFMADAQWILGWGPLPPHYRTFAGTLVELYAVHRDATAIRTSATLPQPGFVSESMRPTVPNPNTPLGSATTLLVDRRPRYLALSGPEALRQPVWLLLSTAERSARIRVSGLGRRRTVELAPYDLAVVKLERPWWRPSWSTYEFIRLKALNKTDILRIPCYARATTRVEDVVRIALEHGRPQAALAALGARAIAASSDALHAQMLLASVGENERAEQLGPAASAARATLAADARPESGGVEVDGNGPVLYSRFSRIRLPGDSPAVLLAEPIKPPRKGAPNEPDWRLDFIRRNGYEWPLYLPAGRYRMSLRMVAYDPKTRQPVQGALRLRDIQGRVLWEGDAAALAEPGLALDFPMQSDYPQQPAWHLETAIPLALAFHKPVLTWDRKEVIRELLAADPLVPESAEAGLFFAPFVRMRELQMQGQQLQGEIVYERAGAPPLDLVLLQRARGKWREVLRQPAAAQLFPEPGTSHAFALDLPADVPPAGLAVGLRTQVRWHAGRLSCPGFDPADCVPLDRLP